MLASPVPSKDKSVLALYRISRKDKKKDRGSVSRGVVNGKLLPFRQQLREVFSNMEEISNGVRTWQDIDNYSQQPGMLSPSHVSNSTLDLGGGMLSPSHVSNSTLDLGTLRWKSWTSRPASGVLEATTGHGLSPHSNGEFVVSEQSGT